MDGPRKLIADEVHVWEVALDAPSEASSGASSCLSAEEKARALRFRFDLHRNRWSVAHEALRQILSRYTGMAPGTLVFEVGDHGKPALALGTTSARVQFNLTHSEDLALVAIAEQSVGIDLEYLGGGCDWERLATRVLTDRERSELSLTPPEGRLRCFYDLWTAKEAYIKARGLGLSLPLKGFSVGAGKVGDPAEPVSDSNPDSSGLWYVHRVPTRPGYTAAVAYPRQDVRLKTFSWPQTPLA